MRPILKESPCSKFLNWELKFPNSNRSFKKCSLFRKRPSFLTWWFHKVINIQLLVYFSGSNYHIKLISLTNNRHLYLSETSSNQTRWKCSFIPVDTSSKSHFKFLSKSNLLLLIAVIKFKDNPKINVQGVIANRCF